MSINLSLGPSYLLRIAGILGALGAVGEVMPDSLPGAKAIKPWCAFATSASVALVGFFARQNLVSTEQAIASKQGLPAPPSPPVPAPVPVPPPPGP